MTSTQDETHPLYSAIIGCGENISVEFKAFANGDYKKKDGEVPSRILKACVALANTKGGQLFLGINDDGKPIGVDDDIDAFKLISCIRRGISPFLDMSINETKIKSKRILILSMSGPNKHKQLYSTGNIVYMRRMLSSGNPENYPLSPYEAASHMNAIGIVDDFKTIISTAPYEMLLDDERNKIRTLIDRFPNSGSSISGLPNKDFDIALGLANEQDREIVPTLAGILLLGSKDLISQYISTHEVIFQVLNGTDVVFNKTYREALPTIVMEVENAFLPLNESTELQVGLLAASISRFNPKVFREALINALIHRDYRASGAVVIQIANEEMRITSPGGFVFGVGLHNILSTGAKPRYPSLAGIIQQIHLAERASRGIDIMFELMLKSGRPAPDYSATTDSEVVVKISGAAPDLRFTKFIADETNKRQLQFRHEELLILSHLRNDNHVCIEELAKIIQKPIPDAQKVLNEMVSNGLLNQYGRRSKTYSLSSHVCSAIGKAKEYSARRVYTHHENTEVIISFLEEKGVITRSDVVELLKTDPDTAYRILRDLKDKGKLQMIGNRRNAYYELRK